MQKITRGQDIAYILLVEHIPFRPYHPRPHLQTAVYQRNIRGHDDIVFNDMLHDPVIRRVKAAFDNLQLRAPLLRKPHPRIGYEYYL